MTYTNQKRLSVKGEASRVRNLIEDHATEEHTAWQNATPKGLKGFDNILLGAVSIMMETIKESDTVEPFDVLMMLKLNRERVEEMVQGYIEIARSETRQTKELKKRISPILSYMHHACTVPHLDSVKDDPAFAGNRLAVEAISILETLIRQP